MKDWFELVLRFVIAVEVMAANMGKKCNCKESVQEGEIISEKETAPPSEGSGPFNLDTETSRPRLMEYATEKGITFAKSIGTENLRKKIKKVLAEREQTEDTKPEETSSPVGNADDMFGEDSPPLIDITVVREALRGYMNRKIKELGDSEKGRIEAVKVLQKYGVDMIADLDPKHYQNMLDDCKEVV